MWLYVDAKRSTLGVILQKSFIFLYSIISFENVTHSQKRAVSASFLTISPPMIFLQNSLPLLKTIIVKCIYNLLSLFGNVDMHTCPQ